MAAALAAGSLAEADLFDTDYRQVEGSDPAQFLTRLVPFADQAMRPLLDAHTARRADIVGCVMIDANGYLPTHITERSRQPGSDPRWNVAYCRNRRIFTGRQLRRAIESDADFALSTYRQDLGEEQFRTLRSVFVPLRFAGRRWGVYELGYRFDAE